MNGVRGTLARVAPVVGGTVLAAFAAAAEPGDRLQTAALGEPGVDLVFTPLAPCRIVDTRTAGGPIPAGGTRDFDVAGALSGQGGAADCGVPFGRATAVAVNLVAVNPAGPGNLRAWPFGQPVPAASVINYTTLNIANALVLPICNPASATCTKDFTVQADVSATHLVADVVGYLHSPFARTVVVRPVPGDNPASGTALLSALAAINPSSCPAIGGDRWLLKLEPGSYDVGSAPLAMKACVDIEGSGQASTRITRAGSDCPGFGTAIGTVSASADAELRELTVENTGGTNCAIGIYSQSALSPRITDVTVRVSGDLNQSSGVRVQDASPELRRVTIKITGPNQNIGVLVAGNSAPILTDVHAESTLGSQNWGIRLASNFGFSGATRIYRSRAIGASGAFFAALEVANPATAYVADTQLEGPVQVTGTLTCHNSYNAVFQAVTCP